MPLITERRGNVGIMTLSRPEARNAWGEDYNQEMPRVLAEWEEDDSIHCVVLTGDERGTAFSAGADLKDPNTHSTASAADFIKALPKWKNFPINLVHDFPKPVIAAVNGYAIGIGCIITYACDVIVASDRAEWRLPQAALGILPAYGGTPRLVQWVGKGLAMKTALGFPIQAEEAYRIGLAQWLVPHEKLMEQALAVAEHLASLPPLAARLVKESVNRGLDISNIRDASLADVYRFFALELTEDKSEGHQAWRERRAPVFHGR